MKYIIGTVLLLIFCLNCKQGILSLKEEKLKGITMVAPPNPFPQNPMDAIKNVHANWVAIIPYAFSKKNSPEVSFDSMGGQWWGELPEGIRESIRLAKNAGLHIMLKPQVWMHNDWVGSMDFNTEEEWLRWEENYRRYILYHTRLATELQVDMLCIATEYNIAAIKRENYFRKLIAEIKTMYPGKLCYSANWDHYREIPFWNALDYIGISAYFPLNDDKTPSINQLTKAWTHILPEMESFSQVTKKQILFTEFGYLSVDGCAGRGWEIEKQIDAHAINQKAQANAYRALFLSLWNKTWWAGGFVWKWFPNGEGHEGYPEKDYTPQGKEAERELTNWYKK